MSTTRYPGILDISLAVLVRAEKGELLTPALVSRALSVSSQFPDTPESFETVKADLDRAHLIDDEARLTPLADNYAAMWRRFLAKRPLA